MEKKNCNESCGIELKSEICLWSHGILYESESERDRDRETAFLNLATNLIGKLAKSWTGKGKYKMNIFLGQKSQEMLKEWCVHLK